MTKHERTGWRDEAISRRHRYFWGDDCPAVDLDFVLVEYDRAVPKALIEYKSVYAKEPDWGHPSYQALQNLSNVANLPFAVVEYDPEQWWFHVKPDNRQAWQVLKRNLLLSEREYVTMLYRLRDRMPPRDVLERLQTRPAPTWPDGMRARKAELKQRPAAKRRYIAQRMPVNLDTARLMIPKVTGERIFIDMWKE